MNPPVEEQELLDMIRTLSKVTATGTNIGAQEALQRLVHLATRGGGGGNDLSEPSHVKNLTPNKVELQAF